MTKNTISTCKHCKWNPESCTSHVLFSIQNKGCVAIIESYDFSLNSENTIEYKLKDIQPSPKKETRGRPKGLATYKTNKFRCVWEDGREPTEHPTLAHIRQIYPSDFPTLSSIKHYQGGRAKRNNFTAHLTLRFLKIEKL